MFNGIQFLNDFNIKYDTIGENIGHGWIGLDCPRCSDSNKHLGYNLNSGIFSCWRCGKMSRTEAVKRIANVQWKEAYQLLKKYDSYSPKKIISPRKVINDIDVRFPKGILDSFPKTHKKYLKQRNFDPDYLIDFWNLKATGHLGAYKFRIIVPIYFDNILISYMGRDITGKSTTKYKACPTDKERYHHKHCLYGIDHVKEKNSVLVVEGMTDVWRLGIGSVALLGINYTHTQVSLLSNFKRIFIYLDETETQAQEQADKLAMELSSLGKDVYCITIGKECDPADLSNDEAAYIMRDLLIR